MAQISIKILLERFTDVRGPVNDSSCLRKPREPWTLDEVVHLEVGFSEEQISGRTRLLFLKNKYVLDTLVWLLFLEHPKTTHSVGIIRGQHYHLVSKDETNSMDSQSAKVMDDTSRFLSPKLLPLLRLSRFEVIDKADIRWWHHQKKVDQFDQNIPYADFANFFTAITHSAIDSLKKTNFVSRKNANVWKKYPLRQLFILQELIGNQFVGEQSEPVKID